MKLSGKLVSGIVASSISISSMVAAQGQDDDPNCPGDGCPAIEAANCPGDGCPAIEATDRTVINALALGVILQMLEERDESGNSGSGVREGTGSPQTQTIQLALKQAGFPPGQIDGVSGPNTRKAISDYQAFLGEDPTGVLTQTQLAALLTRFFDTADESKTPVVASQTQGSKTQGENSDRVIMSCRQDGGQLVCTEIGSGMPVMQLEDDI